MSTERYKVGDTVMVRTDLVNRYDYGGWLIVEDMLAFCGECLTVKSVHNEYDDGYYTLEGSTRRWTDEMLEPIVPAPIDKSNFDDSVSVSDKTKDDLLNLYEERF